MHPPTTTIANTWTLIGFCARSPARSLHSTPLLPTRCAALSASVSSPTTHPPSHATLSHPPFKSPTSRPSIASSSSCASTAPRPHVPLRVVTGLRPLCRVKATASSKSTRRCLRLFRKTRPLHRQCLLVPGSYRAQVASDRTLQTNTSQPNVWVFSSLLRL